MPDFTVPRSVLAPGHPWFGRFFIPQGVVSGGMSYPDPFLRCVLKRSKVIAMVGVSPNPVRPSYFVCRYMSLKGYRVIPVNPGHAGKELFGETVYGALSDIPEETGVDMVDIFRRSEAVPPIVDDAMTHLPKLRTVWMQIGVENAEATQIAEAKGLDVVQNLCPKMEHQRLFGELRKAGFNTRIISSKL